MFGYRFQLFNLSTINFYIPMTFLPSYPLLSTSTFGHQPEGLHVLRNCQLSILNCQLIWFRSYGAHVSNRTVQLQSYRPYGTFFYVSRLFSSPTTPSLNFLSSPLHVSRFTFYVSRFTNKTVSHAAESHYI